MSDRLYRVIFAGVTTGEYDLATTKRRFANLFRLSRGRTHLLFSGKEYVVKNNVSEELAMQLAIKISDAGCECYVQEISDGVNFQEKRAMRERRMKYRRMPRPGAIVPDRRRQIRRGKDLSRYTNLKERHFDLPVALKSYSIYRD